MTSATWTSNDNKGTAVTDNSQIIRRLEKLEDADDKMKEALHQLVVSTTSMAQTLDRLAQLDPVVTQLRLENENSKLVISALKWLAVTVGGSAIVMALAFLFKAGA